MVAGMIGRRQLLQRMALGFGSVASARLLAARSAFETSPRAKSVIFLFLNGGMSQVDTFDPKPALVRHHGQTISGGNPSTATMTGRLMKSPFAFRRHGESGLEISDVFPQLARHADRLCVIRSMWTDRPVHEPAMFLLNTGHSQMGRPSLGAWVSYGLGHVSRNLPSYVVLCSEPPRYTKAMHWASAFLPAEHQGSYVTTGLDGDGASFDPSAMLPNLRPPKGRGLRRRELDLLSDLDGDDGPAHAGALCGEMERAFRMQVTGPEAFDLSLESAATRELYGRGRMARSCLLARRLVERGVPTVQVYFGQSEDWDDHADILGHRRHGQECDQAIAALLDDLAARGLLDETLVVGATEFGRTPSVEVGGGTLDGRLKAGRDHNPHGFSVWLAGAGVRGGTAYGATDECGFRAVDQPVHVHDLQATILHLLGLDHTALTYRYSGREFRLTDVKGRVVQGVLA